MVGLGSDYYQIFRQVWLWCHYVVFTCTFASANNLVSAVIATVQYLLKLLRESTPTTVVLVNTYLSVVFNTPKVFTKTHRAVSPNGTSSSPSSAPKVVSQLVRLPSWYSQHRTSIHILDGDALLNIFYHLCQPVLLEEGEVDTMRRILQGG